MDPLHIALIVLVIAAIWAIVEVALTVRRARGAVDALDDAVRDMNELVVESRPVVAKLDGALDELTPALGKVEPLLSSAHVAVDALSANLVEVEAVVRDVASVTGAAASAGNAVSGVADATSGAVQRLMGKIRPAASEPSRALGGADDLHGDEIPAEAPTPAAQDARPARYYTYVPAGDADDTDSPIADEGDTCHD